MRVYALTSTQITDETLDLFLTREAAEAELREILLDEPDWKEVLRVVPRRAQAPTHEVRASERRLGARRRAETARPAFRFAMGRGVGPSRSSTRLSP